MALAGRAPADHRRFLLRPSGVWRHDLLDTDRDRLAPCPFLPALGMRPHPGAAFPAVSSRARLRPRGPCSPRNSATDQPAISREFLHLRRRALHGPHPVAAGDDRREDERLGPAPPSRPAPRRLGPHRRTLAIAGALVPLQGRGNRRSHHRPCGDQPEDGRNGRDALGRATAPRGELLRRLPLSWQRSLVPQSQLAGRTCCLDPEPTPAAPWQLHRFARPVRLSRDLRGHLREFIEGRSPHGALGPGPRGLALPSGTLRGDDLPGRHRCHGRIPFHSGHDRGSAGPRFQTLQVEGTDHRRTNAPRPARRSTGLPSRDRGHRSLRDRGGDLPLCLHALQGSDRGTGRLLGARPPGLVPDHHRVGLARLRRVGDPLCRCDAPSLGTHC